VIIAVESTTNKKLALFDKPRIKSDFSPPFLVYPELIEKDQL